MSQIHNMLGRKLVAAAGHPISLDVLQFRKREDWEPVLKEMGLTVVDGYIHPSEKFTEGWDTNSNSWMPRPCQLYRFYKGKELLYIGISGRMRERVKAHAEHASWFDASDRVTIEHYSNRLEALDAERAAIKAEHPKYNVVHNLRPTGVTLPPIRVPGTLHCRRCTRYGQNPCACRCHD